MKAIRALLLTSCLVSLGYSCLLGQVFQQTLTGAQLYNLDGNGVNFTAGVGVSLDGDSLDLDPSDNEQILFSWELLPSADRGSLICTVTIDYTPETADNDPVLLISDGTNTVGLVRMDTGTIHAQSYLVNSDSISGRKETSNIFSGTDTVEPFTFEILLEDESASSSLIRFTEGGMSTAAGTSIAYVRALDTDQALSFIWASSSVASGELYQLNSITVTLTAVVEPSLWIWWDSLHSWIYMPENRSSVEGGWIYIPDVSRNK